MPKTEEVKFKKGDLVKYEARVHKGTGVFLRYEPSLKGMWIVLKRDDNSKELALRVSQVKPKAAKPAATPAPAVKPKPVKADPAYVTVIGERDGEFEIDDGYTTQWVPKSQVEQAGKAAADPFESEKLNLIRIKEISDRQGMALHTDHMRSDGLAATGWSAERAGRMRDKATA